jgi:hypothetical protein
MKQTVSLQRVESKTMVLEVVQPLTKETLGAVANGQAAGIGSPGAEAQISSSVSAWRVLRASPECECSASNKSKASKRKGK